MKYVIVFHRADLDGHLSGALVRFWLEEMEKVEDPIEMVPLNYGEPFPWDLIKPEDMVFMVDFSLQPILEMANLSELCHLHWIDHHQTSLANPKNRGDDWMNGIKGIRSADGAACELVWRYFWHEPGVPEATYHMPSFVRWVGFYDRWNQISEWKTIILPFQYALKAQETDPSTEQGYALWKRMLETVKFEGPYSSWMRSLILEGMAVKSYAEREDEKFMKAHAFTSSWGGITWLVVNGGAVNSVRDSPVYDPKVHQAILSYVNVQGNFWRISMRTEKSDLDLSAIAREFGGGGHRKAAGFQIKDLPAELAGPDYGEEPDD